MLESYFRNSFCKRWQKSGGVIHRIPDSKGSPMPGGGFMSAGKRPFDSFGLRDGTYYAIEFKMLNGGKTFNTRTQFKGREHQLRHLKEWNDAGGIGLIVVGWVPTGKRNAITFEIPIGYLCDEWGEVNGDWKCDLSKNTIFRE